MKHRRILLITLVVLMLIMSGTHFAQAADKTYKIGLLILANNEAFIDEMTKLGYVQGKNISYAVPSYENVKPEDWMASYQKQIPVIADAKVDVLVTNTAVDVGNFRPLFGNIPMVFARSDDPVATGTVKSLVKPGGLATGIITNKPHERRLQVLKEIKPTTKKVYYLHNTSMLEADPVLKQVQDVAKQIGVEVVPGPFTDAKSLTAAIDNTPKDADWIFLTPYVLPDPATGQKLLDLSVSLHAGLAYFMDIIPQGYLIGYGPSIDATSRQAARIVDRILRGGNPADLPVETAENYLTVNLEAARAINMNIPESVLRQANLIIRPGYFDTTPTPSK